MNNQEQGVVGGLPLGAASSIGFALSDPMEHHRFSSGDANSLFNAPSSIYSPLEQMGVDPSMYHHLVPISTPEYVPQVSKVSMEQPQQPTSSKAANENSMPTYDDAFPALPESDQPPAGPVGHYSHSLHNSSSSSRNTSAATQKMKIKSTNVSQVHRVAPEDRRSAMNKLGGEAEQARVCKDIMNKTNTVIETSTSRDGTLTFLITGKLEAVETAKRLIGAELQTQSHTTVQIPKPHHRFILGKNRQKLENLQAATGTKIFVPRQAEESETIKIIGTKEAIEKAVHELQVISTEVASRANERLVIEVSPALLLCCLV